MIGISEGGGGPENHAEPKPLKGVGIVIAEEQSDKTHKVMGVIFAPTVEKLREMILAIKSKPMTVNLANVRGGTVTLDKL